MRKPSTSNTYANLIDEKKMETVQKKLKAEQKKKLKAQQNGEFF